MMRVLVLSAIILYILALFDALAWFAGFDLRRLASFTCLVFLGSVLFLSVIVKESDDDDC